MIFVLERKKNTCHWKEILTSIEWAQLNLMNYYLTHLLN